MASYNRIRAASNAPIGTIMPYTGSSSTGGLSETGIPTGWLVCRGQQLKASEYPLLAQILKNQYGPFPETGQPFIGISNSYPEYNDSDIFNLPTLNGVSMIDLEGQRLAAEDLVRVGEFVSANGQDSESQPLTNIVSYVDIEFSVDNTSQLSGKIKGIALDPPAYFDNIRVIPRKLGVEHTPAHTHPRPADGVYPSVETGGTYIGMFEAGVFDVSNTEYTTGASDGHNPAETIADRFNPGDIFWTVYDDASVTLPTLDSFKDYTAAPNAVPDIPAVDRVVSQYAYTNEYQDDNSCIVNVQQPAVSGPYPPPGNYQGQVNHYDTTDVSEARGQDDTKTYPVTLNHPNDTFASASLGSHNHFTIDVTMGGGQMSLPGTLLINNMTTGNVEPISVDRGLSVEINPNTPSLVTLMIIRAF